MGHSGKRGLRHKPPPSSNIQGDGAGVVARGDGDDLFAPTTSPRRTRHQYAAIGMKASAIMLELYWPIYSAIKPWRHDFLAETEAAIDMPRY